LDGTAPFADDVTALRGQLLGLMQEFCDRRPHGPTAIATIVALQQAGNALGMVEGLLQEERPHPG
jgi:hypothetical protein